MLILQVNKHVLSHYGQSLISLYRVTETDTLVMPSGKASVLEIVVYNADIQMLKALSLEPLHSIIQGILVDTPLMPSGKASVLEIVVYMETVLVGF